VGCLIRRRSPSKDRDENWLSGRRVTALPTASHEVELLSRVL